MRRFALAATVGSARKVLALVIALLAIAAAGYLGSHPLSNPDHMNAYGSCSVLQIPSDLMFHDYACAPPSRYVWQIPAAVLLGLAGLGMALVVAGRHRPRRSLPAGISRSLLPRV